MERGRGQSSKVCDGLALTTYMSLHKRDQQRSMDVMYNGPKSSWSNGCCRDVERLRLRCTTWNGLSLPSVLPSASDTDYEVANIGNKQSIEWPLDKINARTPGKRKKQHLSVGKR